MRLEYRLSVGDQRVEVEFLDPPLSFVAAFQCVLNSLPPPHASSDLVARITIKWLGETYDELRQRQVSAGSDHGFFPIHAWHLPSQRASQAGPSWHTRIDDPLRLTLFHPERRTIEVFRVILAGVDHSPNTLLVPLLQPVFAARQSLLVHAAGVIMGDRAALITGPSGAGKSTATSLLGGFVLSDDIVCLTGLSGEPSVSSTPFGRLSDGIGTSRLGAVFFPRKAPFCQIKRLAPREAAVRFLRQHRAFFQIDTFHDLRRAISERALELFERVPAYDLFFELSYIDRESVAAALGARCA